MLFDYEFTLARGCTVLSRIDKNRRGQDKDAVMVNGMSRFRKWCAAGWPFLRHDGRTVSCVGWPGRGSRLPWRVRIYRSHVLILRSEVDR